LWKIPTTTHLRLNASSQYHSTEQSRHHSLGDVRAQTPFQETNPVSVFSFEERHRVGSRVIWISACPVNNKNHFFSFFFITRKNTAVSLVFFAEKTS